MPGAAWDSILNPAMYEALRDKGMSKERAAKISNASPKAQKKKKAKPKGR